MLEEKTTTVVLTASATEELCISRRHVAQVTKQALALPGKDFERVLAWEVAGQSSAGEDLGEIKVLLAGEGLPMHCGIGAGTQGLSCTHVGLSLQPQRYLPGLNDILSSPNVDDFIA